MMIAFYQCLDNLLCHRNQSNCKVAKNTRKNSISCQYTYRRFQVYSCSNSLSRMDSSRQVKKESTERVEFVGIQHAGLLVENTEKARDFYVRVLGMKDVSSERPNLPYDGAFIQVGTQQIHLMQLPSVDPKEGRPTHGGRDRHVAFGVSNLDRLVSRLEQYGHAYTFSKSGRRAIFCRDVDGNALEFVEMA